MTLQDTARTDEDPGERRPINSVLEAVSFRISRLAAINERAGGHVFRSAFGISLNEWRILGITAALQPVTFGAIRAMLVMDKGQLSRVVKALIERKLIESRSASGDARQIELSLTEAGQALHAQAIEFTVERNAVMGSVLSDEEWQL
ncbi:MarR family winged helix-turn-helix transcriptional regulator, partial [Cribrihabitans sp. XS_ASV171]